MKEHEINHQETIYQLMEVVEENRNKIASLEERENIWSEEIKILKEHEINRLNEKFQRLKIEVASLKRQIETELCLKRPRVLKESDDSNPDKSQLI